MRWVTFDQGNSTLKWCLWESEGDEPARIVSCGAAGDEPLERALREPAAAAPAAAFYSGVAAEERALAARAGYRVGRCPLGGKLRDCVAAAVEVFNLENWQWSF